MIDLKPHFKVSAETAAFKAFVKVAKRHKIYFPVLSEIYKFMFDNKERPIEYIQGINLPLGIFTKNHIKWDNFHKRILSAVDNNAFHMGCKSEYDFLIHCVNTMIQIFLEQRIARNNTRNLKIPRFDVLGQEIFDLAAKKVFGKDFVDHAPQNTSTNDCAPRNQCEQQYANNLFEDCMRRGMNPQDAITFISHAIRKLHANEEETQPHSDYYNRVKDEDYDEDSSYEDNTTDWDDYLWSDD